MPSTASSTATPTSIAGLACQGPEDAIRCVDGSSMSGNRARR